MEQKKPKQPPWSSPIYDSSKRALGQNLDLPTLGKNLSVDLGKRLAHELGVTKCWVCGGALLSEDWSWKGTSLSAFYLFQWNHMWLNMKRVDPGPGFSPQ